MDFCCDEQIEEAMDLDKVIRCEKSVNILHMLPSTVPHVALAYSSRIVGLEFTPPIAQDDVQKE